MEPPVRRVMPAVWVKVKKLMVPLRASTVPALLKMAKAVVPVPADFTTLPALLKTVRSLPRCSEGASVWMSKVPLWRFSVTAPNPAFSAPVPVQVMRLELTAFREACALVPGPPMSTPPLVNDLPGPSAVPPVQGSGPLKR